MEFIIVLAIIAVAFFIYKESKKDKQSAPVEVSGSHAGRYTGSINPPDGNVWGDGTNPSEAVVLAEHPDWRGLGYRLGGSFDFIVAADGKLSGTFTLWGNVIAITSGQIPAGQNVVSFSVAGATGNMTFNNGRVSGRICEPHDCAYKYGNIEGAR